MENIKLNKRLIKKALKIFDWCSKDMLYIEQVPGKTLFTITPNIITPGRDSLIVTDEKGRFVVGDYQDRDRLIYQHECENNKLIRFLSWIVREK